MPKDGYGYGSIAPNSQMIAIVIWKLAPIELQLFD